jgi:hypothetical protein
MIDDLISFAFTHPVPVVIVLALIALVTLSIGTKLGRRL